MKNLKLSLFILVAFVNFGLAQIIGADFADKKYTAWKQSKLYVVKTTDNDINTELESAVKASFPNFAGALSMAEADKLMDNENNFFVTIFYPGTNMIKQNNWDKFAFGFGIFQGKEKKILKIDFYRDFLIRTEYLPVAPNLNVTIYAPEARALYTKTGLDKTFKPEPTIKSMISSTILNFKQCLDALDKTEGVKGSKQMHSAVAKILSEDVALLKNKTLIVLNNSMTDDFYNAYSFKKEKAEPNDISKLTSKDKKYCFLKYYIDGSTDTHASFIKQIAIIDCETGKVIYETSAYGSATMSGMTKKQAEILNNAVNGKAE